MAEQGTYFVVADKVEDETVFYRVPGSLKGFYDVYRERRLKQGSYSFSEFRQFAHKWFDRFPEGLEILHTIVPIVITSEWGFRMPGYYISISKN